MGRRILLGVVSVMLPLASVVWAETIRVSMKDRAFIPQRIIVKVGDTVQWVNEDTELHEVISGITIYDRDLGRPLNSGLLMWDSRYVFTFTKRGSYRYMCVIHRTLEDARDAQGMVGEVVVEP